MEADGVTVPLRGCYCPGNAGKHHRMERKQGPAHYGSIYIFLIKIIVYLDHNYSTFSMPYILN